MSKEYYQQLYIKCGELIDESFQGDRADALNLSHSYVADVNKWINVLASRLEVSLLQMALREYQYALLALVQGQYGQAFMGLRLFLELSIGMIYFSANELELRIWLNGERDNNWSAITDIDNGIFAKKFARAFFEELQDNTPAYRAIALQVYRECSEYVHGNATTKATLPDKLEFMESAFFDWHEKAKNVKFVISFALCLRYLKNLNKSELDILEPIILDHLGHLPALRYFLGVAV